MFKNDKNVFGRYRFDEEDLNKVHSLEAEFKKDTYGEGDSTLSKSSTNATNVCLQICESFNFNFTEEYFYIYSSILKVMRYMSNNNS